MHQLECTGLLGCPAQRAFRRRRRADAAAWFSTSISSPLAQTGDGEGSRGIVRVQASTSSDRRRTAGAEEGSESKSEPKSAQREKGADGKAEGGSRDWVRRSLCVTPIVSRQQPTPLQKLSACPSMKIPAQHGLEKRLCAAQSSARRDYTWSCTVPNRTSRYTYPWHVADCHTRAPCPWARHTAPELTLSAALPISNYCPPLQQIACAGCCNAFIGSSMLCPAHAS